MAKHRNDNLPFVASRLESFEHKIDTIFEQNVRKRERQPQVAIQLDNT